MIPILDQHSWSKMLLDPIDSVIDVKVTVVHEGTQAPTLSAGKVYAD